MRFYFDLPDDQQIIGPRHNYAVVVPFTYCNYARELQQEELRAFATEVVELTREEKNEKKTCS